MNNTFPITPKERENQVLKGILHPTCHTVPRERLLKAAFPDKSDKECQNIYARFVDDRAERETRPLTDVEIALRGPRPQPVGTKAQVIKAMYRHEADLTEIEFNSLRGEILHWRDSTDIPRIKAESGQQGGKKRVANAERKAKAGKKVRKRKKSI